MCWGRPNKGHKHFLIYTENIGPDSAVHRDMGPCPDEGDCPHCTFLIDGNLECDGEKDNVIQNFETQHKTLQVMDILYQGEVTGSDGITQSEWWICAARY